MIRPILAPLAALLMAAAVSAADSTPASTTVAARDSLVAIMGRVAYAEDGSAQMGFPGSIIRFAYRGAAPTLRFAASSDDCLFNLAVHGWEPVPIRLKTGENAFELPSGVAPEGGYVVELTRRTESWQGVATFHGIDVPAGCTLLPPPAWPTRKLMFIGDSMTCGQYADRMPPENDATARTSNAARAFGMILGRRLGAQVHLVSYGGRGVMRDWEGKTDTGTAPEFFERSLPDDPTSRWNHAGYQPDVVVICLGQNDLNQGLPDANEFAAIYARFVDRIREAHPQAGIIMAESAMQGEWPGSEDARRREFLRAATDVVIARRRAAGDTRVALAPIHKVPGTVHDSHPVAFQHEQIAEQLLGPIKRLTRW